MTRRALAALAVLLAAGCGTAADQDASATAVAGAEQASSACRAADVVPEDGVLFGVNPDWAQQTLVEVADVLGRSPAVAVSFTRFPMSAADVGNVDAAVEQVRDAGGVLLLTLEPHDGIAAVTATAADALAEDLARWNANGVPVVVRFAHEMNGSWYPWGQQPAAYVQAFRTVADAVHQHAPGSAMMWAPNYAGGYPFTGGRYAAAPGSADAAALDSDRDGSVTSVDDAYAPYYPGDDAVDWVGLSLYHWGSAHPWGEDELPEPGKFAAQLTGTYVGLGGDDSAAPDFYGVYGLQHGKPVAIPETAALVTPAAGDQHELAIKQAWWRQVLSPETAERFPQVKMINWFEWAKDEVEIGGRVDWRIGSSDVVRDAFRDDAPMWLRSAEDLPAC